MSKTIALTQGEVAIVDDEDYKELSRVKWCVTIWDGKAYALRGNNNGTGFVRMHRQIMDCPDNMVIDHINGNGLDNRKCNLRIVTHRENIINRTKRNKNNSTGVRGVSWDKSRNLYQCGIKVNGKRISLGRYASLSDASLAYDDAARGYFGNAYSEGYRKSVQIDGGENGKGA